MYGIALLFLTTWTTLSIHLNDGDTVIRGKVGDSEIVITTTKRVAGAIHSLTWKGKEFIDSFDHGRQLQSAVNYDAGSPITAETYNPTEAGSRDDGKGAKSSSKLLHAVVTESALQTTIQPAFWLAPGQKSGNHTAKNTTVLSNHLITKRVVIGYKEMANVVRYDVVFHVPIGEKHTHAVFEAVTGYMPAEFEKFWKYDPKKKELEPLTDGPGEQAFPVVLADVGGKYAMGIFSPDQPAKGWESVGYGRFRFKSEKVVKWNCVFRVHDEKNGILPGEYGFRNFIAIGDLDTIKDTLQKLHAEFRPE